MNWKLPLFKMNWNEKDVEAVSNVIKRGSHWADGPEIEEFENKIAEFTKTKYAAAFNSGTSALHTLLLACGVKGKEVIVPSFTFIATVNAVVLAGGTPVFAEVEQETFGLDAEDVANKISDKTAAILPVHYAGSCCRDIEKIKDICNHKNLLLIEDAAESLGSDIDGKNAGSFGHATIFSFCQNKVISSGEGGMVVTNDEELYKKIKLIRSHGRLELENQNYFSNIHDNNYLEAGYNYRMSSMTAALGSSQLDRIREIIDRRQKNAKFLNESMKNIKEVSCPIALSGFNHAYQLYTIVINTEEQRNSLQEFLKQKGIMTKVYFNPVHLKSFYKENYGFKEGDLPKTESFSNRVLTLPLYVDLNEDDMNFIISSIKEFFDRGSFTETGIKTTKIEEITETTKGELK